MLRGIVLAMAAWLLLSGAVLAHHSREYIELESYTTAKQGQKVIYTHYDYFVMDSDNPKQDHYELTPGFSYGITDRLMLDCHTHFAKFGPAHIVPGEDAYDPIGPSPFLEAVALTGHYRISEPEQFPFDIAGSLLYEYPLPTSKRLLDGASAFELTLIISKEVGKDTNICCNLNTGQEGDEWMNGYGLGIKTPIGSDSKGAEVGLEIFGDFKNAFRALPGAYLPLQDNTTLKLGLGLGNKASQEELRFHISLMMRY
ncbi:MAG: hypothetical protein AB1599_08600 [Planctomycetota bacterium]